MKNIIKINHLYFTMASIWCHMMSTDVYTTFSSLEEAYYFVYRLFDMIDTYCTVITKLQTQSVVLMGSDPYLQVSIYYGTSSPPIKNEWYPNGITQISKETLRNHKEYIRRISIYEMEHCKNKKITKLIRTKSHSSLLHELCK